MMFSKNSIRKKLYWKFCEKRLVEQANALQVLRPEHEMSLRRLGVTTYVRNISNGCNLSDTLDFKQRIPNISVATPMKLLYLGRLDKQRKGIDILIKSLALLPDDLRTKLSLSFVGKSHGDDAFLVDLANGLHCSDMITWHGALETSASEIIREHDVLILPSRFDGFGLVVLEAILAGKPVIVSDAAGAHSLVKASGAGIVVKPEEKSIAEGIYKMYGIRDNWHTMVTKGQAYLYENASWDIISEQTEKFYNTVVS